MEVGELVEKIKKAPLDRYIFGGEEDYLKRYYAKELVRAAIGDEADIFNYTVFDGEDVSFKDLREAILSPSLMSDCKVVEWRFCNLEGMKEKELAELEELAALQEDYPDTLLIITAAADGLEFSAGKNPSKLERRLGKHYNLVNFKKSTDRQLLGWLKRHFDANGVGVDADTLNALLMRSGRVMDVLANEVTKLTALAKIRSLDKVSVSDVEQVCSTTPESETFALQNAICAKDRAAAFRALSDLKFRRVDPAIIMAMMARTFTELMNAAMLVRDGDADKLEELFGIKGFRAKMCIAGAKRYGAEALVKITGEISRLDAASKFGGINGYKLCEIIVSEYIYNNIGNKNEFI